MLRSYSDYYPFGMLMPGRNHNPDEAKYGFNGMYKDDEIKGSGNSYDFGARLYDSRVGRWLSVDPLEMKYNDMTPYQFAGNTPIQAYDPDGELIIWVNGEAPQDEWARREYWSHSHPFVNAVGSFNQKAQDFNNLFRNADQTKYKAGLDWPNDRKANGQAQARADFESIKASLKADMVDGKITETVKIISHSKGSAYANGYAEVLDAELAKWREEEPQLFAGKGGTIELTVHLAPHQSAFINVQENDYPTISINHEGDVLSGNKATGDIINITTETPENAANSHTIAGLWDQLNKVYDQIQSNIKNNVIDKDCGMDGLLDNQTDFNSGGN
jgi:RHS repeat-associated protein